MNASSSTPIRMAPQRLSAGTRMSAAPTVSAMPNTSAAARLSEPGTRNCMIRAAQPSGSVIFQTPEVTNNRASTTAASQLSLLFQSGNSSVCKRSEPLQRLCHTVDHGPYCSLCDGCQGRHSRMIAFTLFMALAAASRIELANEVYSIPPNEWRYLEVGLKQQAALVVAR